MSDALNFAQQWWAFNIAKDRFEEELGELMGCEVEKIGTDNYDYSLEIYNVPPDIRLSTEAQRFIRDAGYARVYVNHTDKWETHYTWAGGEFTPARGWRRLRREGGGFDISYWPDGWADKSWLASGYIRIVPDPRETAPPSQQTAAEPSP